MASLGHNEFNHQCWQGASHVDSEDHSTMTPWHGLLALCEGNPSVIGIPNKLLNRQYIETRWHTLRHCNTDKTSYHRILWRFEARVLVTRIIVSIWNLTCTSATETSVGMPFARESVVPHLSATLMERCTGERRALSTRRCSPQCLFYWEGGWRKWYKRLYRQRIS